MPLQAKDPREKLAIAHSPNGVSVIIPYANYSRFHFNSLSRRTVGGWPTTDRNTLPPTFIEAWGSPGYGYQFSSGVHPQGRHNPRQSYMYAKSIIAAFGEGLYDCLCSNNPSQTFNKDSGKLDFLIREYMTMQAPISERVIPWGRGAFISLDGRSPCNPGESLALFVELVHDMQSFDYDNPFIVQVTLCLYAEGSQFHPGNDCWCHRHCVGYGLHDTLPFIDCSEPDAVAIADKLVGMIPPKLAAILSKSSRHGVVEPWEYFVGEFTPILNANFPRYVPEKEITVRF